MARRGAATPGGRQWSRAFSVRTVKIVRGLKRQKLIGSARKSIDSDDTLVASSPSTSPPTTSAKRISESRSRPQYETKGVQADLPQPSSQSSSSGTASSSSSSRPKPAETLPSLAYYGGAYPKLEFNPSLKLGDWSMESGKLPEVEYGNPTKTFHHFTELPTELRLKIWRMHLARPRVVRISTIDFVKKIHFRANSLGNRASNIQWYTTNKLPVLTRVCQEARAETLNFYRVHLSQDQRTFYFSPVYLNPEWDMVLLNCTHDAFPMDIFLSDVLAYDPKGVGVVHLGSYVDPGKWDCAPLPGCAALDESTKNMESYTQCTYVGSLKVDVYPILKVGEGYLLESVAVDRSKFVTYMPHVGRYPRLPPDRSLEIEDQLARLLPVELMQRLRMQTLFSRTHSSRMDASTRSLATNERAAGLVVWNKERDGREWDGVREYTYFSCN